MNRTFAFGFFLLFVHTAHAAFVSGQIRNAAPGTPIEILVPHRYIDGQDSRYAGVLDEQLQFTLPAKVPEPQMIFLLFNDDRLALFLSPDDTLSIKSDAFQFPLVVSFGGPAAEENRVLQDFLRRQPTDFNEFNNIRFKIGQYWASVELPVNNFIESLLPVQCREHFDSLRANAIALLERAEQQSPGQLSVDFLAWLHAEIDYFWAYHLLLYGQVYGSRYSVQPEFFEFLYEAPTFHQSIGSGWYRQFLLAAMARQQAKFGADAENFWAGEYQLAGKFLTGKPLAFLRSEIIVSAFSAEKYRDILPIYTNFLQTNEYPAYDEKVEGLYNKYARVLPGSPAPAFEVTDAEGRILNLGYWQGKVLYINFWASWCGACLRKMEFVDDFETELRASGVEILNVSLDEASEAWLSALAEHSFKGFHVLAKAAQGRNLALVFGVEAVPQYFIIGRDGRFVEKAASSQPADIRQQLLRIAAKQ